MAGTENEFVDPLEEIDPIMREAFSEEDIVENDNLQSLDDELDAMLDTIEEDDALSLDNDDTSTSLNDELDTLDDIDSLNLETNETETIENSDQIETTPETSEEIIEVSESVYTIDNESNENLITNDLEDLEDLEDEDILLEDLDDSLLSEDSYSVEEAYPSSDIPEEITPEHKDEIIEENIHGNLAKVEFPELQSEEEPKQTFSQNLFNNIPIEVSVELGRTRISLKEIYELGKGSIIELEKLTGETLDLIVNDQIIAKGEVVTVDNKYGLRIKELSEEKPEI